MKTISFQRLRPGAYGLPLEAHGSTMLRLVLGSIFLVAGASKLGNREMFLEAVLSYDLVSIGGAEVVAAVLPWLELLCGIYLLSNHWVRESACWAGGLLAMFLVLTLLSMARGLTPECGCFQFAFLPRGLTAGGWALVARDLVMLGMAVGVAGAAGTPRSRGAGTFTGYETRDARGMIHET